jgi:hypothetical protein
MHIASLTWVVFLSEEVLGSGSALWFSPDGSYLAFATFNDTNVKTASYFHYGQPGSLESQYSETVNIRYPKVSDINHIFLSEKYETPNQIIIRLVPSASIITSILLYSDPRTRRKYRSKLEGTKMQISRGFLTSRWFIITHTNKNYGGKLKLFCFQLKLAE